MKLDSYDPIGWYNTIRQSVDLTTLRLRSQHRLAVDTAYGNLVLMVRWPACRTSYLVGWNLQTEDFRFDRSSVTLEPLRHFQRGEGRLPNIRKHGPIESGGVQLAGAVAIDVTLPPRGHHEVPAVLAWHFPERHTGHWYERRFRSALSIARAVHHRRTTRYRHIVRWQQMVERCALPPWLSDALINNLYPLATASLWSRGGQFALLEAPRDCPLVGTLDVAFYGSIPVTLFFPSLDRIWLNLFADAQRSNGYIPHDLGRECFDAPSNGTTNF